MVLTRKSSGREGVISNDHDRINNGVLSFDESAYEVCGQKNSKDFVRDRWE